MRRTVAGVVALLLISLTIAAAINFSSEEKAEGLARDFARVDSTYQTATQQFITETQGLKEADLRTSLRLYGIVLAAAQQAQEGYEDLDVLDSMERPRERVLKALEVQVRALESAISAARDQDPATAGDATRGFQAATLAYQAARAQLKAAIDRCGARCS
jgi:DNA anti-recombination protein RmuC